MSAIDENEEFEFRLRAERESKPNNTEEQQNQSWGTLPANATNKMLSGMADSVLNTPNNLLNLGKAAVGTVAAATGHPEYAPDITQNPDYISKLASKHGLIENKQMTPAQKVADKLIQSGGAMLMSPANSLKQAAGNVGTGVLSAAAGDVAGKVTGSPYAEIAANIATPAAISTISNKITQASIAKKAINAQRDATLKEGVDAGYVVPPSAVKPTFLKNRLEGVAGKAAIKQESTARNQEVTNALAKKALDLPDDQPITVAVLEARRKEYGKPYDEVSNLPSTARADYNSTYGAKRSVGADVEDWKQANSDATSWYEAYKRSASPDDLVKAKSYSAKATDLHKSIVDTAKRAGREDLVEKLDKARVEIAKTYTVQKALNDSNGEISAPVIGALFNKGKPLSPELKTIGKFNKAFPQFTTPGAKNPAAGVSKIEALTSFILGLGGGTAGGAVFGPVGAVGGAALAAIPLASHPTRAMLLSKPFQGVPSSNVDKIAELLSKASTKDVQKLAGIVSAQQATQGE